MRLCSSEPLTHFNTGGPRLHDSFIIPEIRNLKSQISNLKSQISNPQNLKSPKFEIRVIRVICGFLASRRVDRLTSRFCHLALLTIIAVLPSCGHKPNHEAKAPPPQKDPGALVRVGSLTIYQSDLDQQLKDSQGARGDAPTRQQALDELTGRAQLAQAALDAGLERDPVVRAELARVLASRLRETTLAPRLKALKAAVPEARLREIYAAESARFQSNEKRQVAVLWLNPNGNPQREKQYTDKLAVARDWLFKNADLAAHPDQGFAVLAVDHSEHQATRYKGGVVGWLERGGGSDAWTKAVVEIAFSLKEAGDVSTVISRPEGVFLVRLMALQAAVLRPFEAVTAELDRLERQRLTQQAQAEFDNSIKTKYPLRRLPPPQ